MATDNAYVFSDILSGLADSSVVPYLGCHALAGVVEAATGRAIPADSDSLILAITTANRWRPS